MAIAFDGTYVPDTLPAMPCGGIPEFDDDSGYAYRCDKCGVVIGSMSMNPNCAKALEAQNAAGVDIYDAVRESKPSSTLQAPADVASPFKVFF